MQIKDKVAIVTGGGSGIGEAWAKSFHDEGASGLVVVDRDKSNAERVAQTVGGTAIELDVTDEAGIADLVNQTIKDHGNLDLSSDIRHVRPSPLDFTTGRAQPPIDLVGKEEEKPKDNERLLPTTASNAEGNNKKKKKSKGERLI